MPFPGPFEAMLLLVTGLISVCFSVPGEEQAPDFKAATS